MIHPFDPLIGRRILIVDDSPQITALLGDVFACCGVPVATANSGCDAMVQIQLGDFDLVFLDLVMPHPDGWEVLRFMESVKADLVSRTILLTGNRYDRHTRHRIGHAELRAVYKPFSVAGIRAVACEVLLTRHPTHAA